MTPKFIIQDWAGNVLLKGKQFDSFDDAWGYIYYAFPEDDWTEVFVVKAKTRPSRYLDPKDPRVGKKAV